MKRFLQRTISEEKKKAYMQTSSHVNETQRRHLVHQLLASHPEFDKLRQLHRRMVLRRNARLGPSARRDDSAWDREHRETEITSSVSRGLTIEERLKVQNANDVMKRVRTLALLCIVNPLT